MATAAISTTHVSKSALKIPIRRDLNCYLLGCTLPQQWLIGVERTENINIVWKYRRYQRCGYKSARCRLLSDAFSAWWFASFARSMQSASFQTLPTIYCNMRWFVVVLSKAPDWKVIKLRTIFCCSPSDPPNIHKNTLNTAYFYLFIITIT